jgi:hypothetical protein
VDQVAAKARIDFRLDKTTTIVGAKGVAKDCLLTYSILEAAARQKFEGFVEKWMRQQKQDIAVKLVSVYEREAPDNATILNDEAGDGPKEGKASKLSLLKFSNFRTVQKTEKQIQRQAIIDSQHADDLQVRWTCQRACPNRKSWCYIMDNIHLKLYPQNLKKLEHCD